MGGAEENNSEFSGLLCDDTISRVVNNSSKHMFMQQVMVYFKNGHSLSIIRGAYSRGGGEGLFEIMPNDKLFLDECDSGDYVCGHLTPDRVSYYINKIGSMSKRGSA